MCIFESAHHPHDDPSQTCSAMDSGCASGVFGDVSDHFGHLRDTFQSKSVHAPDRPLRVAETALRVTLRSGWYRRIGCISVNEKNYNFRLVFGFFCECAKSPSRTFLQLFKSVFVIGMSPGKWMQSTVRRIEGIDFMMKIY
jgi:hypothetical protein